MKIRWRKNTKSIKC